MVSLANGGPVRFNHPAVDNLALFCTSLVRSERHERPCQQMVEEFRRQLEMSLPTFASMGEHAVVIRDTKALFRRVDTAARRERYTFRAKPVTYYDSYPQQLLLEPDDSIEPVFHKHETYRLQREYRFAIETYTEDTGLVRLHIGSIRDIAMYMKTNTLLNKLQFRMAPERRGDRSDNPS